MSFRRITYCLFLPLLLMAVATSCVYDEILDDVKDKNPSGPEASGKFTVQMYIRSVGSDSRADDDANDDEIKNGDFVDGSHDEHKIGSNGNFVIFFDENKNFFSISPLTFTHHETPDNSVTESLYETSLNPDDFENLPAYCLVLLNAPDYYTLFSDYTDKKTSADVLGEIVTNTTDPTKIGLTDDGLFTMSNSTYYDASGVLQQLVPISELNIFDPSDPVSVANSRPIVVYVERLSAKFSLTVQGKSDNDNPYSFNFDFNVNSDNYSNVEQIIMFDGFTADNKPMFSARKWGVDLLGWNINGIEKKEYLFKKIVPGSKYFADWNWKDPAAYRVYWAEDPDYLGPYPWQYRRSDNFPLNYYEGMEKEKENFLRNRSFDELGLADMNFSKSVFVPENTYDFDALDGNYDQRTNLLAGSHLLLGARLKIEDESGQISEGDFYRDREGFYYDSEVDCFRAIVYSINNSLSSQQKMRFQYYEWGYPNSEQRGRELFARTHLNANNIPYKLYWNDIELTDDTIQALYKSGNLKLEPATIQGGDGKRFPWPSSGTINIKRSGVSPGSGSDLEIYYTYEVTETVTVDGVKKEITRTVEQTIRKTPSQNDIKSILLEWFGAFDHFNNGLMYYAAPAVIHYNDPDDRSVTSNNNICGVVRNNWYRYNVNKISSIGTPVDNPSEPIVPQSPAINDQINVTISIIDWHLVPTKIPSLP